jgi:hypothetical protein
MRSLLPPVAEEYEIMTKKRRRRLMTLGVMLLLKVATFWAWTHFYAS